MRILVVDDSPEALALVKHHLASEGHEVLCAESGQAGLEAASREPPDLILLDVDMPDLSGFEVCRKLKNDVNLSLIPVIFLSGSGGHEDKIRGLDLGAVDYVIKPFDAFELRARIRAALRTKHLQDLLAQRSRIDPLTGLANRGAFDERLGQEWARIRRRGGLLSLVMVDIDHFKRVNDTYGHTVGDRVLCAVASVIAGQCRDTDMATRYGGDEFAILVPGEAASGAAQFAERCRQAVETISLKVEAAVVRVTASFGVADSAEAASPDVLVQQSDQALYRAKQGGRNRVEAAKTARPVGNT